MFYYARAVKVHCSFCYRTTKGRYLSRLREKGMKISLCMFSFMKPRKKTDTRPEPKQGGAH